jgi:hypothetical protein
VHPCHRFTPVEGCLKTLLKVLLAHPGYGWLAHLHSIRDLPIDSARPLRALVGFEQDPSVGELAGTGAVPAAIRLFRCSR